MCGKTRQNKVINKNIRKCVVVLPIVEKMVEIDLGDLDM